MDPGKIACVSFYNCMHQTKMKSIMRVNSNELLSVRYVQDVNVYIS